MMDYVLRYIFNFSLLKVQRLQYRSEMSVPKNTQNTGMRMRTYAYTLCARMLISMYELAVLFFLLLIVDCSFNDLTLRHLKVHGRMNKSCRAKESLHVYFYRKY